MTILEFNGNYYIFTRLEQFNYFTKDQITKYYWILLKYFNNYLIDNNKLEMLNSFSKLTATTKKKLLVLANAEYFNNKKLDSETNNFENNNSQNNNFENNNKIYFEDISNNNF